jgi:hypothetical protein
MIGKKTCSTDENGKPSPGEVLEDFELRERQIDQEHSFGSFIDAINDAYDATLGEMFEKSPIERMEAKQSFEDSNKHLNLHPNILAAKMICTSLEAIARHLKEIKHHRMGISEYDEPT